MDVPDIDELVIAAMQSRKSWIAELNTDSYRLFHGVAEGAPGVTVDRYASEVVVQVFRESLEEDWQSLAACILEAQEGVSAVRVVRRGKGKEVLATVGELADRTECHEEGCKFWNSFGQVGNDPWFYLDFRSSRRFVAEVAKDARVANFFSYTGTAAVVAAKAGAKSVTNIDFGRWCLDVAKENCELNGVKSRIVKDDFFAVARQWAGGQAKNRRRGGRGARREASYKPESFELVILDPPTRSNGPNGAVDILRDYPSLAKPCVQMVAEGGWLLCTHHHTGIGFDEWQSIVHRTAAKIGRTVVESQRILPDKDFPIVGEEPLLKVLAVKLA
ncbi:MAG: class I SAM-dependent methyltransferase [Kofleriaceae bacterium]|nr:class I SAM-dependent methyltransferase [Kofleriaceae bacterium]